MIYRTETDLPTLLDALTNGEHIKATWAQGAYLTIIEGPVRIQGREVFCRGFLRSASGTINTSLTSLEVTRNEEVTVTRDDQDTLHALLDSLENGDTVTAEWGNKDGSVSITGKARADRAFREVYGYSSNILRQYSGLLPHNLRSVTIRRIAVKRWERRGP